LSGSALAAAIKSLIDWIGDFGLTTTMLKERATSATAARSRCWS
jgi:hypothetical protein